MYSHFVVSIEPWLRSALGYLFVLFCFVFGYCFLGNKRLFYWIHKDIRLILGMLSLKVKNNIKILKIKLSQVFFEINDNFYWEF